MPSVIAAYSAAWIICMIYVFTLHTRQRRLRATLEELRREHHE